MASSLPVTFLVAVVAILQDECVRAENVAAWLSA
jgi:hypothetical protein